jgi:hypothetical protein
LNNDIPRHGAIRYIRPNTHTTYNHSLTAVHCDSKFVGPDPYVDSIVARLRAVQRPVPQPRSKAANADADLEERVHGTAGSQA